MNRIAGKHWTSWDQVDPPRSFPGSPYQPAKPGQTLIWDDPWYQEWQVFRQHIIALHYDELSLWANEAGIPRDRIFSAEGFIAPDEGQSPFAVRITSHGQNYDTSGVSIEGSIPRAGHLGAVLYGETAENQAPMEVPHSLFATFSRMDPGWAVVETNATNLKKPLVQPHYSQSYHAFRDMFNFDAQEVSVMAWNGSNGLYSAMPGYLPYTAWRNTPAEAAMRDFMVTHANLPRGARLWTFGAPGYPDDDGWRLEQGKVYARGGYLDLEFDGETATLLSPPDQVIRTATIDATRAGIARSVACCRDADIRASRCEIAVGNNRYANFRGQVPAQCGGRAGATGLACGMARKGSHRRGAQNRIGIRCRRRACENRSNRAVPEQSTFDIVSRALP